VVLRFPGRFDELLDYMWRGGMIGIAHAKVDNILARSPRLQFHFVEGGKKIGGESLNTCKFHKPSIKPFRFDHLA
jgi:hypothetical protein